MPMEKQATLMRKGFRELQEMSSRKQHSQEWSPPSSSRTDPSGTSQAVENLVGDIFWTTAKRALTCFAFLNGNMFGQCMGPTVGHSSHLGPFAWEGCALPPPPNSPVPSVVLTGAEVGAG